jgi:hypothetical protein
VRNRIKAHRIVKARDLKAHPRNWRVHPIGQRQALQTMIEEVGFARSCTAYEDANGDLILIDGHLRAELDPDAELTVEILDVTPEEADKLLLTFDPIGQLAAANAEKRQELFESLHARTREASEVFRRLTPRPFQVDPARRPAPRFAIVIECAHEEQQLTLLERFQREQLPCRAIFF